MRWGIGLFSENRFRRAEGRMRLPRTPNQCYSSKCREGNRFGKSWPLTALCIPPPRRQPNYGHVGFSSRFDRFHHRTQSLLVALLDFSRTECLPGSPTHRECKSRHCHYTSRERTQRERQRQRQRERQRQRQRDRQRDRQRTQVVGIRSPSERQGASRRFPLLWFVGNNGHWYNNAQKNRRLAPCRSRIP
jgi:hypothetical protein